MIKFYNTLTQKKEVFKPLKNKKINLFVCGPTVYDFSHLGHARTYVSFDMIVNYLKYQGYKVFYLQNITDVDDKIIKRAKERGKNWDEISRFFEKEYYKDIKKLKINSVTKYARATSHVKEIQSQVKRLLEKGYAYQIDDGIYYDIKKFKDYGKLSKRTITQAEDSTSRIDESVQKRNKGDFCLWKYIKSLSSLKARSMRKGTHKYKLIDNEPAWSSTFGWGRPGWHIEDTAITEKYFGPQYDIHGGARDLIFPHHEAEISQMEAISGKAPLVRYWLHTGFLTIEGQKMSKSLGNFITIQDFLKKYSPEVLRFIVFSSHYRSPLDFSEKIAKEAKVNLKKLEEFLKNLKEKSKSSKSQNGKLIKGFKDKFWKILEDDFNTPKAKALIFDFLTKINKKRISQKEAREIYSFFKEVNRILGFLDFKKIEKKEIFPTKVKELAIQREKYRKQGNFKKADEIRRKIEKLGYKVEDTKEGPKLKRTS